MFSSAELSPNPDNRFMTQVVRNFTGFDGELSDVRYLIHNRDGKYTADFETSSDRQKSRQ